MKQLIEDIAKALVDIPEEVAVHVVEGEQVTVLELRVAPSDLGKVIGKQAESTWRNPFVIGGMLIAVGVLMYLAENAGRRQRGLSSIDLPDAVTIGVAQALAVVPGTSRSGITISAGLFRNMTRESAARF